MRDCRSLFPRAFLIAAVLVSLFADEGIAARRQETRPPPAPTEVAGDAPRMRPRVTLSRPGRSYQLTGLPAIIAILVVLFVPSFLFFRWLRIRRESKVAHRALSDVQAELRSVFAAIPEIIFVLSRDGRYLRVPETSANPLYLPGTNLVGQVFTDELSPDAAARALAAIAEAIDTGTPVSMEYSLPLEEPVWLSVTVSRLDADSVVWVARDVTADRKAQEALTQSEKRYRLFFEHNPAPMWVYDRTSLKFLEVNTAAVEHYGYSLDEFSAMTILDLREPEEQQRLLEFLAARPSEQLTHFEARHLRKDGSVIDVEVRSHSIEVPGREGRLVLVTDVTERRELQERLLQSQKMEAIGQLAGGVAHDFNNLLTVITGYAAMLLSDLDPEHASRTDVLEIQSAAERATILTRQLLAFSRRQVLQPKVIDLNQLISDLSRMLQRLLREDIEVTMDLAPDLWHVSADPSQIEQVIVNLMVNSRDALPSGGRIKIETNNVILDEEYAHLHADARPGPYVVLSATDTGTGMTPEIRSRVFEPFFTTKSKGSGTGLGLATVYGIVKQSGGYIWVYSEPGHGTTIKIYFPRDTRPTDSEQELVPTLEQTGRESGTILVVEDEDLVRKAVCRILNRFGFEVLEAENGAAALGIFDSHPEPILLVISDMVMPKMGGQEVITALRERGSDVPVLLMSGYNENAALNQTGLDSGSLFLNKPFTPDSLMDKVRNVLMHV